MSSQIDADGSEGRSFRAKPWWFAFGALVLGGMSAGGFAAAWHASSILTKLGEASLGLACFVAGALLASWYWRMPPIMFIGRDGIHHRTQLSCSLPWSQVSRVAVRPSASPILILIEGHGLGTYHPQNLIERLGFKQHRPDDLLMLSTVFVGGAPGEIMAAFTRYAPPWVGIED